MLLTLRKKIICLTVLHTVFVLFASQLTAALPFSMRTSSLIVFSINNSLKALFGQNMKKVKILKLSPDSRYLQKLALNKFLSFFGCSFNHWFV